MKELEEGREIEKIIEGLDRDTIKFEFTVFKNLNNLGDKKNNLDPTPLREPIQIQTRHLYTE